MITLPADLHRERRRGLPGVPRLARAFLRWGLIVALGTLLGATLTGGLTGCVSDPPKKTSKGDEFESATDRAPTARTLYSMARVLALQGRDRDCEYILKKALKEAPDFMPAYCALAECQMRQRHVDDAEATLQAGLGKAPKEAVLRNDLGMVRMIKGEHEAALGDFAAAVEAAPLDARYKANRAAALGMLGRYDESLAAYQEVLPAHEAHYNLAVLCEARLDKARAQTEYQQAEALRPKSSEEKEAKKAKEAKSS